MTAAALTRFQLHRQKSFDHDFEGMPKLLNKATTRLNKLFYGRMSWNIKSIKGMIAASRLRYHAKGISNTRKARDQRYHTDYQVLKVLLSRLNIQPKHNEFSWLQVRWTAIEDICSLTGFSRSTVNDSLSRLTKADILRTKRRKNPTKDREWVAVRWITSTLFEMLGLGTWLKNQKSGRYKQTAPEPVPDDPSLDAISDPALRTAVARLKRHRTRNSDPPDENTDKQERSQ